eukprot:2275080-Alexandrium_andersonii.AAC.1
MLIFRNGLGADWLRRWRGGDASSPPHVYATIGQAGNTIMARRALTTHFRATSATCSTSSGRKVIWWSPSLHVAGLIIIPLAKAIRACVCGRVRVCARA